MRFAPIVIIGSSRSGTTLLAKILTENGIFFGADVESNHESRSLQAVNRWILLNASAGLEQPERVDRLLADPFLRQVAREAVFQYTVARHSAAFWGESVGDRHSARWGFKDPRTTFTLPIWMDVFPYAKVIHIQRNGQAVARSLSVRRDRAMQAWDGDVARRIAQHRAAANLEVQDLAGGVDLWARYCARAHAHVMALGRQATTIHFEQLVDHPTVVLDRLGAFLDMDLVLGGDRPGRLPAGPRLTNI